MTEQQKRTHKARLALERGQFDIRPLAPHSWRVINGEGGTYTVRLQNNAWAGHIGYLKLTCACRAASRVARLGDWITPLALHTDLEAFPSWEAFTDANVQAVRQAVAALAAAVPADDLALDTLTRIVHQVLAGLLAPSAAIAELHALLKAKA